MCGNMKCTYSTCKVTEQLGSLTCLDLDHTALSALLISLYTNTGLSQQRYPRGNVTFRKPQTKMLTHCVCLPTAEDAGIVMCGSVEACMPTSLDNFQRYCQTLFFNYDQKNHLMIRLGRAIF